MPKINATHGIYQALSGNWVACLVCPRKHGELLTMQKRHVHSHSSSQVHRRHLQRHCEGPLQPLPSEKDSVFNDGFFNGEVYPCNPRFSPYKTRETSPQFQYYPSDVQDYDINIRAEEDCGSFNNTPQDAQTHLSFGELWDGSLNNRTFILAGDGEDVDYFAEALHSLESGQQSLSMFRPLTEELGVDGEDSFGIEVPAMDDFTRPKRSKNLPVPLDCPTYPWPSMEMFLTDLLFSSPRLRFSQPQKTAILEWAQSLHARGVPTLNALENTRKRIKDLVGDPTEKVTSPSGNIFYVNDIAKAIAKDYANPITRFSMTDYPEDAGQGMSQVFHGEKMLLDIPPEIAPSTVRVNGQIFFVNELLRRSSGAYFIPEHFFYRTTSCDANTGTVSTKELHALGFDVHESDAGFVVDEERTITPISTFKQTYKDIISTEGKPLRFAVSSMSYGSKMPHPLHEAADGRMVYSVPLIIFMDDVSGNISKQWNKHHVIYASNANMPREMLEKEFYLRFVSSSPHASPMELMRGMKDCICKAMQSGVLAYDCKYHEEVLLCPYGLFWGGDNPMQAEECSHGGLRCNYLCRTCKAGGTKEYKETNGGYESIFKSAELRTPDDTQATICEQLRLAILPGGTEKVKSATASTGIRDSTTASIINYLLELGKSLRKRETGKQAISEEEIQARLTQEMEDQLRSCSINPLIGMPGVNIHMDTPTEILHTILLGVVKYFWGQSVVLLEKGHSMPIFQARLSSVDTNGLNAPSFNADYICRYKGSLIGKHFKSLAQVMPFLVYDLVPRKVLDGWTCIGALVVLLWHTEIQDTEEYLAELSRVIEDFLNITAQCAPSILISKPKFHFLVHLPAYIRRFGPAIIFSTERYESFNHVFRLACIYSNRQAPSRDTCNIFAHQDTIKHVATGGFWFDPSTKTWVQAGEDILQYVREHPHSAHMLGLRGVTQKETDHAKLVLAIHEDGKRKRPTTVSWNETQCSQVEGSPLTASLTHARFRQAQSFVGRNGDNITIGSYIIFNDTLNSASKLLPGRVDEILVNENGPQTAAYIVTQPFDILPSLHAVYHLPSLRLTASKKVIKPMDVVSAVNIQHDCASSGCTEAQSRVQQERRETTKTQAIIAHSPTDRFVLNTNSIHNYQHIKSMIPPELWSWTAIVTDPENVRKQAARHLRLTKAKKKEGMDPTSANTENTPPAAPLEGALEGLQPQATCDPPSFELPHFERAPQRKSKPRLKVKAKPAVANKKEPSNGPGVSPLMNIAPSMSQMYQHPPHAFSVVPTTAHYPPYPYSGPPTSTATPLHACVPLYYYNSMTAPSVFTHNHPILPSVQSTNANTS